MSRGGPRYSTLYVARTIRDLIERDPVSDDEHELDGLHEPREGLRDQLMANVTVSGPTEVRAGQCSLLITAEDSDSYSGGAWNVVITRVPRRKKATP